MSRNVLEAFFSQDDQQAIREAVTRAEGRTAGEVVPYVAAASGSYAGAPWRGAALGAMLTVVAAATLHTVGDYWGGSPWTWGVLPLAIGTILGFVAAAVFPGFRRWLIPAFQMEEQVELRAAAAFVEAEVFQTRERTGVLLFISLFEHRVLVLTDSGIHAQVDQSAWDGIAQDLAGGLREGRPVPALLTAVAAVGNLLEERGLERRPDDANELPDGLRLGDA